MYEKFGRDWGVGREALKTVKVSVVNKSGGILEDQNARRNVDNEDCTFAIQDGDKCFIGNWTRG